MGALFIHRSHGDFTAIVDLPAGRHEYKFFVDGQWLHDPNEVTLYHSIPQYTTVYHSIPQYTTVYRSIPQYHSISQYATVYRSTGKQVQILQLHDIVLSDIGPHSSFPWESNSSMIMYVSFVRCLSPPLSLPLSLSLSLPLSLVHTGSHRQWSGEL